MDTHEINEIIQTALENIQQYKITREPKSLNKAYTLVNNITASSRFNNLTEESQGYIMNLKACLSIPKFYLNGQLKYLEDAVVYARKAVELTPDNYNNKTLYLNTLADTLSNRFNQIGNIQDLEDAVVYAKKTVELTQDDHPDKVLYLNTLISILSSRFNRIGNIQDLEDAVVYAKKIVELTPNNHPNKAIFLNNLSTILNFRFNRIGNIKDLEAAVGYAKKAVELLPNNHPDKAGIFNTLATILSVRFNQTGNIKDLEVAIVYAKNAIKLTPDNHSKKAERLNNLANILSDRYKQIGNKQDIEDAVMYLKKVVDMTPDNHPHKTGRLTNLSTTLRDRFKRIGNVQDLKDAIVYAKKAIELAPDDHPDKAMYFNNLADSLCARFKQIGNIQDLEDAVNYSKRAVELTPDNYLNKAVYLNTMAIILSDRFSRIGNIQDMEDAVVYAKKVIDLTPDNHPDKAMYLNNLSIMLSDRFKRIGNIEDLENTVVNAKKAVELSPDSHPDKVLYLDTLANCLSERFNRIGNIQDLEDAVGYAKKAVELNPDNHYDKASRLNNLANRLSIRFNRIGNMQDLEDAVWYAKKAIELSPGIYPDNAIFFNTLANILSHRFNQIGNIQDLEDTVWYAKKAVELTPDSHPDKVLYLNTLANSLNDRFNRNGNIQDLEDAVGYAKKTKELTPDDHPNIAVYLNTLATMLSDRFNHIGNIQDMEDAVELYNKILNQKDSLNPKVFIMVVRNLATLYFKQQQWQPALQAYQTGKDKIDTLILQHGLRSSKEAWMKETQGFPDQMAYTIGKLDRKEEALLALENGRARLLSTQLVRKNFNIDTLKLKDNNLAQEYLNVINKINVLQKKELETGQEYKKLQEDLVIENTKLKDIVDRIRKIPGFERVLEEISKENIVKSAKTAPLIYLATTSAGTLVLIVQKEGIIISKWCDRITGDILREKMFGLKNSETIGGYFGAYQKWKTTPRRGTPNNVLRSIRQTWLDTLVGITGWLWDNLMGDIVDYLKDSGYEQAVLLPGGLLGLLPLHAAWTIDETQVSKKRYAMDDILFTYAPNAQALLNAQDNKNREENSVMIVDNPDGSLHFSHAEAEAVKEYFDEDKVLHLESDKATFDEITKNISNYNILHFSTHGGVNYSHPLNSGLLTANEKQPLQLRNILQLDLENVRLAVLSACDTGVPGLMLLDEVISLPTGCLQAGIPGIVSSLWSVSDCSTMILMERFYFYWKEEKEPIAQALRSAQQWVRDTPHEEIMKHFEKWISKETLAELERRMSENAVIGVYADLNRMDDDGFKHPYYWAAFGFTGV